LASDDQQQQLADFLRTICGLTEINCERDLLDLISAPRVPAAISELASHVTGWTMRIADS
jgi:hypothetical protein